MNSASSMHEAGHSKLVLWDNLEGWGGKSEGLLGMGEGVQVLPGWLVLMCGGGHHSNVKWLSSN